MYSALSAADPYTMSSDRNLINRRNVKMPVDKNYTNCREFFLMEVETRVTAMAMLVLGMNDISDDPMKNIPPTLESPGILKKIYLGKTSNMIYNDYICESEKATKIMKAILTQEEVRYSTVL